MTAHDVFISYAQQDKLVAEATCALLERGGVRCWMAPPDQNDYVENYERSIDVASNAFRGMLVVFSDRTNNSPLIEQEIQRAASAGLWIVALRIEEVAPRPFFDQYISRSHWLDAFTPPLDQHLGRLTSTVQRLLAMMDDVDTAAPASESGPTSERPTIAGATAKLNWIFDSWIYFPTRDVFPDGDSRAPRYLTEANRMADWDLAACHAGGIGGYYQRDMDVATASNKKQAIWIATWHPHDGTSETLIRGSSGAAYRACVDHHQALWREHE